jgi:2-methylcitrate dehydratase
MVEIARRNRPDPNKIVSIELEVFQLAFDFAGGGLYGVDKVIRTKEQADHNLAYLLSVALIDGDVKPAQFKPERIAKPDVQALLKKVSIRPNTEFTAQYPQKMPAKITIRLRDGTVVEHQVQDYPGLASHPFTWEESVEKFDALVVGRVDAALSREIKEAVLSLESIQARDLVKLLSYAKTPTRGTNDGGRNLSRMRTA